MGLPARRAHAVRRAHLGLVTVTVPVALAVAIAVALVLGGTAFAVFTLAATGTGQVQAGNLDAPSGLALSGSVTRTTVPLQWAGPATTPATTPATATTEYLVLRCTGNGCSPSPTDALATGGCAGPVTATSCTDTTALAGTTYTYVVVAADHDWTSAGSSALAVTTPAPARLAVTPGQGAPGQVVHLTGTGFTTGGTLGAAIGGAPIPLTGLTRVTPSGTWTAAVTLPKVPGGQAVVTASRKGGDTATAAFTVVPALSLSATQGAPGASITVNGDGFSASSPVAFSFAPQGLAASALTPATCTPAATDATGTLPAGPLDLAACRITIPADAPPGPGTVTVTDGAGATASATVTVLANRLVFTSTAVTGPPASSADLGPITLERETPTGAPLTTGTLDVVLGASPSAGTTFSATATGPPVSSVTIPAGASSATVWLGDSSPGTVTVSASASASASAAAPNFSAASQEETVTAAQGLWLTGVSFQGGTTGITGITGITGTSGTTGATAITCTDPVNDATSCMGTMAPGSSLTGSVAFVTATGAPVAYSATAAASLVAQVAQVQVVSGFPLAVPGGATTSASAFSATAAGAGGVELTISFGPYALHLDVSS